MERYNNIGGEVTSFPRFRRFRRLTTRISNGSTSVGNINSILSAGRTTTITVVRCSAVAGQKNRPTLHARGIAAAAA